MNFTVTQIAEICEGTFLTKQTEKILSIHEVITDSRQELANKAFLAFCGERFDAHDFIDDVLKKKPALIIVSKDLQAETIKNAEEQCCSILKVTDTLLAYQEIAHANLLAHPECKVIGITGSTGKTSVKSIISQVLEHYYPNEVLATIGNTNNHIGVPQNLLRLNKKHKVAVLEMGTSSPNEISRLVEIAPPDIAILTGVGHSHIGNFPEFSDLVKEKTDILRNRKESTQCIIHESVLPLLDTQADLKNLNPLVYGESKELDCSIDYHHSTIDSSNFTLITDHCSLFIDHCSLSGRHQAINSGAAILSLKALGLNFDKVPNALQKLSLPGGRMKIEKVKDFTFINDAYNANPQSMKASIDWFSEIKHDGRKIIIVGDMLELGKHSLDLHQKITEQLSQSTLKDTVSFAVGQDSSQALKTIASTTFLDSQSAAQNIEKHLKQNDLILLKASRGIALEKIIKYLQDQT